MSAFARSKRPATLSRLRRGDRVVAVLAAVVAPEFVWLIATVGFGQHLYQPGFGGSAPQELSIWLVAAVAGIAALAGAGVLALIERVDRRPAQVWLVGLDGTADPLPGRTALRRGYFHRQQAGACVHAPRRGCCADPAPLPQRSAPPRREPIRD
jgi:hypothetical protein